MTNDVKEAATRMLRHYEAIKSSETYSDSPHYTGTLQWSEQGIANDESTLARVYLAEVLVAKIKAEVIRDLLREIIHPIADDPPMKYVNVQIDKKTYAEMQSAIGATE